MKESLPNQENNPVYQNLLMHVGKRCELALKDNTKLVGRLDFAGFGPTNNLVIILDTGEHRVTDKYDLSLGNIVGVREVD